VDKAFLLEWCAFLNDFRDPFLLSATAPVESVELVRGSEHSSVVRQAERDWRIKPGDLPADPVSTKTLLSSLTHLKIVKFVNDVVNAADLPEYGLTSPLSRFILKSQGQGPAGDPTNTVATELDFGTSTNRLDWVYAKRSDESFVYAVSSNDFARLPTALWQLRERSLCRFPVDEVAGVTLKQGDKRCQLIHKGPLSWGFAPGSQGIINDAALEETIRGIIQSSAIAWVAQGQGARAVYGFGAEDYHLLLELKNGASFDLEFGGEAPSGDRYAQVNLEGQPWILQFPWILYRDIFSYLPLAPRH
jgi:hypothetical protein